MMKKETTHRLILTRGNIFSRLMHLSFPIMFGMFMFTLYMVSDLFFISRLGPDAVAALSISGNVFFIHLGLSFIIGTGAMSLIARHFGAENFEKARVVFEQSILLSLMAGGVIAITGILVAGPYIRFFGGTGMAYTWGVDYFTVYSVSLLVLLLLHVFGACLRGMGDTKTAMKITFQALVLNIVLDPLLIFGWGVFPQMGVKGAAVASLISQVYALAIYIYLVFFRDKLIRLNGIFKPDIGVIRQSLVIGLPSGLAYFLLTANMLITYKVVSPYGTHALAAIGIGFRVIQAIYLPSVAIADAMAAMVGQNFGANHRGRIIATFFKGWQVSCLVMAAGTLLCWLCPGVLIGFFSKDPEVIHYGTMYLTIVSISNILVGTILTVSAVFQGIGHTLPSLVCALADNLLFVVAVFTLPVIFGWGFHAIWWIKFTATCIETGLITYWLYKKMQATRTAPVCT